MYRPSTLKPETAWARHLDAVMRERNLSQTQMFEIVGAELALGPKSRTAFRAFLQKREPDEAQSAVLRKHFGEPPAEAAPPEPQPDLAAALTALAAELKAAREERARYLAMEETLEALRQTVADLLRSNRTSAGSAVSQGRRAPSGTAG